MTNKQLENKIEEIMRTAPMERPIWHMVGHDIRRRLISLCKEYADTKDKFWYCKKDELWVRNGMECPVCKQAREKINGY